MKNYLAILFLLVFTAIAFADRACLVGYNSAYMVSDCTYEVTPKMTWVQYTNFLNKGDQTGIFTEQKTFDYVRAIYFKGCQYNQYFYDKYGDCQP